MSASRTLPLPVLILTGFLGSGKTTLLSTLLRMPEAANTAVVINEFGEISIDHFLVEAVDGNVAVLSGGCLCCTMSGSLSDTLADLFARRARGEVPHFERIIVETTGLADPAAVINTINASSILKDVYRLDGVITTVDAVFGEGQLASHDDSMRQVALADRLVVTKADLADAATVEALIGRLREINPTSPVLVAQEGRIDKPAELLEPAFSLDRAKAAAAWLNASYNAHDHDAHHHHHGNKGHRHGIRSLSFYVDRPVTWERYAAFVERMKALPGRQLLRFKGILSIEGSRRPFAVHGVQHVFYPPVALENEITDARSRIVVIVEELSDETLAAAFGELGIGRLTEVRA